MSINSAPTHTATYRNFYVIQYDSSGNQLSSTVVNSGGTVTLASNCDKIMLDTYLVKTSLTGMECHFKDIIIE